MNTTTSPTETVEIMSGARAVLDEKDRIWLEVDGFSRSLIGGGRYERTEITQRWFADLCGLNGRVLVAAIRARDTRSIRRAYRDIGH
jgi:hypothetical protein